MEEILLSMMDDNPCNSRIHYDDVEIHKLSQSLSQSGLLSPVLLRKFKDRFQIVCGHRRVRAARILGWRTIKAEIISRSDKEMLEASIVENIARKSLSDYELAKSFERMNREFGSTIEEIGQTTGISRSHVANYLRMLDLFDEETLGKDPVLLKAIHGLSEHHSRVLLRIKNQQARAQAFKLVVDERMSVRELERMISSLRSWFDGPRDATPEVILEPANNNSKLKDYMEVQKAVSDMFRLPFTDDFKAFVDLHLFDEGFSAWSAFPPYERLNGHQSLDKDREWFYSVAPRIAAKVSDLDIKFFGDVSLATFYLNLRSQISNGNRGTNVRGTIVFHRKFKCWKIVHEHWSKLESSSSKKKVYELI